MDEKPRLGASQSSLPSLTTEIESIRSALDVGDFDTANQRLTAHKHRLRHSPDRCQLRSKTAEWCLTTGRDLHGTMHNNAARVVVRWAIRLVPFEKSRALKARSLSLLAVIEEDLGRFGAARRTYRIAARRMRRLRPVTDEVLFRRAQLLDNWAAFANDAGRSRKAGLLYRTAERLWNRIVAPSGHMIDARAIGIMNRAITAKQRESPARALELYDSALNLWQSIESPDDSTLDSIANCRSNRAVALHDLGHYKQAATDYQRADTLFTSISDPRDSTKDRHAACIANYAMLLSDASDSREALTQLLRADRIWSSIGNPSADTLDSWALALSNLATTHAGHRDLTPALATYDRAEQLWNRINGETDWTLHARAMALGLKASLLDEIGDSAGARDNYARSLELFRRVRAPHDDIYDSRANTLANFGLLLVRTEDYRGASQAYREADTLWNRIRHPSANTLHQHAHCLSNWAAMLDGLGETGYAAKQFISADSLWARIEELTDDHRYLWASSYHARQLHMEPVDPRKTRYLELAIALMNHVTENDRPVFTVFHLELILERLQHLVQPDVKAEYRQTLSALKERLRHHNRLERVSDPSLMGWLVLSPYYPLPKDNDDLNRRVRVTESGTYSVSNGGGNGMVFIARSRNHPGRLFCVKVNRHLSYDEDEWNREYEFTKAVAQHGLTEHLVSTVFTGTVDRGIGSLRETEWARAEELLRANYSVDFPEGKPDLWEAQRDRKLLIMDGVLGETLFHFVYERRLEIEESIDAGRISEAAKCYTQYLEETVPHLHDLLKNGIAPMHEQLGYVHRDIKTGNIMVEKDLTGAVRRMVLVDYGLVCRLENGRCTDLPGIGTTTCLAPETATPRNLPCYRNGACAQWNSCVEERRRRCPLTGLPREVAYTPASDQFMCGMVLWEVLHLIQPRPRDPSLGKADRLLREVLSPESAENYYGDTRRLLNSFEPAFSRETRHLLHSVEAIARRATAPEPEQRFSSVSALIQAW